jgi:hypothetical protein
MVKQDYRKGGVRRIACGRSSVEERSEEMTESFWGRTDI